MGRAGASKVFIGLLLEMLLTVAASGFRLTASKPRTSPSRHLPSNLPLANGDRPCGGVSGKSGGGPPHSKTLARVRCPTPREASWSAPILWRFCRHDGHAPRGWWLRGARRAPSPGRSPLDDWTSRIAIQTFRIDGLISPITGWRGKIPCRTSGIDEWTPRFSRLTGRIDDLTARIALQTRRIAGWIPKTGHFQFQVIDTACPLVDPTRQVAKPGRPVADGSCPDTDSCSPFADAARPERDGSRPVSKNGTPVGEKTCPLADGRCLEGDSRCLAGDSDQLPVARFLPSRDRIFASPRSRTALEEVAFG
jgi:hypothetical protein